MELVPPWVIKIIIDDVMAGGSVLKQVDALYEAGAAGKARWRDGLSRTAARER